MKIKIEYSSKRVYDSNNIFRKLYQFLTKKYEFQMQWFVTCKYDDGSVVKFRRPTYEDAIILKQSMLLTNPHED